MIEDTTFLFTNRNTLDYLKPAIDSLLDIVPEAKNRISIFDDDSLPEEKKELREWATKNNFRLMTWRKYNPKDLMEKYEISVHARLYGYILEDVASRIQTKNLILCDSDLVFLSSEFIPFFEEELNAGSKIICPLSLEHAPNKAISMIKNSMYAPLIKEKSIERFHTYFCCVDLDFLKENDLIFDKMEETHGFRLLSTGFSEGFTDPLWNYDYWALEFGTDWLLRTKQKGVKFTAFANKYNSYIPETEIQYRPDDSTPLHNFVYHFKGGGTRNSYGTQNSLINSGSLSSREEAVKRFESLLPKDNNYLQRYINEGRMYFFQRIRKELEADSSLLKKMIKYHPWMFK